MKASGVYQILNRINGKRYVGSAVNLRKRWGSHRSFLRHGNHPNPYLQNAWNLYGSKAFAFGVLEYVPDLERLLEREQHYMDALHPEYNIAPIAGSAFGIKRSEETKQKMSKAQKARVRIISAETAARMSAAQKGHEVSEETRQKMSAAQKGKVHTEEAKRKMSEASRGKVHSAETRQKLSAALTGKVIPLETKQKMSMAQRGKNGSGAKLTEQDVREIKTLLQESGLRYGEIAARYGVEQSTIGRIKRGCAWSHINNETESDPPAMLGGVLLAE
ncbi:MAG: NUMOD3 domain-containing DNA-binding protein [Chloroflexota bacterium]